MDNQLLLLVYCLIDCLGDSVDLGIWWNQVHIVVVLTTLRLRGWFCDTIFFRRPRCLCRLFRYEFPVSGGEAGIWFHLRFFLLDRKELQFFQAEETTRRVDTLPGKGEFFSGKMSKLHPALCHIFLPERFLPERTVLGHCKTSLLLLKMPNANER